MNRKNQLKFPVPIRVECPCCEACFYLELKGLQFNYSKNFSPIKKVKS